MTQVLISIRPEWVAKELNGEKNVEVRLNVPKCDLPCEVFIYCTKGGKKLQGLNGKVAAKFIMNEYDIIDEIDFELLEDMFAETIDIYTSWASKYKTCVSTRQAYDYAKHRDIYLWLMDNLEVFDTPRELGDFYKGWVTSKQEFIDKAMKKDIVAKAMKDNPQNAIEILDIEYEKYLEANQIIHAPQSWCYVKEIRQ